MKRFSKYLCIIIVCLLLAVVTACGDDTSKSGTEKSPSGESANKKEPDLKKEDGDLTKIVIWGGVPEENGPSQLVEAFNESQEDIVAEYVRFVNDETGNTKLDTALLSGEQIDVYFTYSIPILVKRIEGGMAEDLASFAVETFIQETIGEEEGIFKYEDSYYSIPTIREPNYIMLNKSILDELNIPVPTEWTVDEYREIAKKLVDESDGNKRYAIQGGINIARTILGDDYWYKEGAEESNFDDPAFSYSYQINYDMMYEDASSFPYSEILARKMEVYAQDLFLNGEIGMMSSAPWHLRYVNDTEEYPHDWITTFAPWPVPEKGKDFYNNGTLGNYIMMNSKSKYKEEAWKLIEYWLTDGSIYMIPGGKMPVWNAVDTDEVVKGLLGDEPEKLYDVEAFKRVALDSNIKFAIDSEIIAAPQIQQIIKEEEDRLYLQEQTIEETIANIKERADKAIKDAAK